MTMEQLSARMEEISKSVWQHEQQLQPVRSAPLVTRAEAEKLYGPAAMQKHLSAKGAAPLSLAGLRGDAAQVQPAAIPEVAALPELGDSSVKIGTVLKSGEAVYRRGANAWEPITAPVVVTQTTTQGTAGGSGNIPPVEAVSTQGVAALTIDVVSAIGAKATFLTVTVDLGPSGSVKVLSDGSNPPVTEIADATVGAAGGVVPISLWALPGSFLKIETVAGTPSIVRATQWY